MKQKAILTIIMSNYNQAHLIKNAIDSILQQQTSFPWQLIITDDHSTQDNSKEIIMQYHSLYPDKIKYIFSEKNTGYLGNILRAKALAKTDFLTLLDADDYWTDINYLEKAIKYLQKNLDVVAYTQNVLCISENGKQFSFISKKKKSGKYTIQDYFAQKMPITQTTGAVFRNVIFKNSIPKIMTDAIGTIHERSFEGDADRLIMHLKFGKIYFSNEYSGIYRCLSSGIWQKLSNSEKSILTAQAYLDYNKYFDYIYQDIFIKKAYSEMQKSINSLGYIHVNMDNKMQQIFANVLKECLNHTDKLQLDKPKNIFYKFLLKIYKFSYKKLHKKNYL
ncbi:glycosyltransferase family 2 protein [Campylobacter jejuni]|uniref:glycosyltransferase family 2 protein n=1 Tax=Campylobacter jejuni TaxID=197 RepID=UPI000F7FBCF5|nr:glycosyltransferase family 2 protein [Campylobacter jejuni]RTJ71572.1 glycosyl transferase [Campylobacter jejuni]